MSYSCKDPSCTETVAWHLLNADPDCVEENQQVLEEWVAAAEAALQSHHVVLSISVAGFEDQQVQVDLIPVTDIPHSTPDEDEPVVVPPVVVTDVTDNGHGHMQEGL